MYNRYIPQADGTYQRRRLPDQIPKPPAPPPPAPPEPPIPPCPPPVPPRRPMPRPRPRPTSRETSQDNSITGFLKQLLPRDFDAGDLLVVVLLLLMSGDCGEDQNTALLPLALYLFM